MNKSVLAPPLSLMRWVRGSDVDVLDDGLGAEKYGGPGSLRNSVALHPDH
jgi:hypothetical protein